MRSPTWQPIDNNTNVPIRAEVSAELIQWAAERSKLNQEELDHRFPKLESWLTGDLKPTLRQLERFAKATATPFGYFFLVAPPNEPVPIRDFRRMPGGAERPSPDLLDTIYQAQQRQEWYRQYAEASGHDAVPFVNTLTLQTPIPQAAAMMRETLNFGLGARGSTWSEAFRVMCENAEAVGILVMVNGVVGANTHRKLDPQEFRGFALVDTLAPIVFVNNADTKAAQIFTLAHELAHIWLGQTALDNANLALAYQGEVETWANRVAAEFLVPLEEITTRFDPHEDLTVELNRLAGFFKVSTLVVLRRINEAGFMEWATFQEAYQHELARVLALADESAGGGGGNYYNTQPVRVSKALARAVIRDTLEGRTTYTQAFSLLGMKNTSTFVEMGDRLGVT